MKKIESLIFPYPSQIVLYAAPPSGPRSPYSPENEKQPAEQLNGHNLHIWRVPTQPQYVNMICSVTNSSSGLLFVKIRAKSGWFFSKNPGEIQVCDFVVFMWFSALVILPQTQPKTHPNIQTPSQTQSFSIKKEDDCLSQEQQRLDLLLSSVKPLAWSSLEVSSWTKFFWTRHLDWDLTAIASRVSCLLSNSLAYNTDLDQHSRKGNTRVD